MPQLLSKLAVALIALVAMGWTGGVMLGATSSETQVRDLVVTCLSCGEQWPFAPSATLGAGFLSLIKRRKPVDKCPRCGSRAATFGHPSHDAQSQRRIS